MESKQRIGFSAIRRLAWCNAIAFGLALLSGCASTTARDSAEPASRSADRTTPVVEPAAAPAPSVAKAPPRSASVADLPPDEAVIVAKGDSMTDADREALAELIQARVEGQVAANRTVSAAPRPDPPRSVPDRANSAAVPNQPTTAVPQVPPTTPAPQTPPATPAAPAKPAESGGARMELSPNDFDFKEVWQGAPAEGEFVIKNVGTAPLTLETRSSCGCTVATKPKSPLAPGEETSFKISFSTTHATVAQKTVTVTTNDPDQPSVVIKVHGTVKALVAATPSDRIVFNDLDVDTVQSQTIRLEPKYDTPINLTLHESQNIGPFTLELKEVEPGKVYEVTATTKPPLRVNMNNATALLDTGLEKVPTIPVFLIAGVRPKVAVSPPRLHVMPTAAQPSEQIVEVQYRVTTSVAITDVKCSPDSVKWELLPAEEPPAGAKLVSRRVRVTLPPYSELPEAGGMLKIFTDEADAQYKELDVPITKVAAPSPARTAAPTSVAPAAK